MYDFQIGEKIIVKRILGAITIQGFDIASIYEIDETYIYCQIPFKYSYIPVKFSRKTGKEFRNKNLIRYELTKTRAVEIYDFIEEKK